MKINLSILKDKYFLLYSTSQWINSLGDAVFVIALTWLLVQSTGSPVIVGSYLFIIGIVKSIFILFGGVIVDRVDSRKLMIFSDLTRGILMFLFFILNLNGIPPLWVFYLIAAIFGMVGSVAEPAEITSGTRIVDKEHYSQSLSLLMATGNVSEIIGPMLGAWLFYWGGPQTAILTNGVSYIVSVILLLLVRFRKAESKNDETIVGILSGLFEGFNCFFKTKIIRIMAIQAFFTNASVSATVVAIPFLLKDIGFGVREYGIVNTSLGVGSAIGAVAFSLIVIKNPRPSMVLLTVFLQGITLSIIGLSNHLWLILIFYIIIGIEEAAINILAPSVNHVIIPQRIFGRVLGVMILMMTISRPFSQAGAGWLMETIHPQYIFIGSGIMEVLVALVTFSFPVIRNYANSKIG